jgi:hypothetical protein
MRHARIPEITQTLTEWAKAAKGKNVSYAFPESGAETCLLLWLLSVTPEASQRALRGMGELPVSATYIIIPCGDDTLKTHEALHQIFASAASPSPSALVEISLSPERVPDAFWAGLHIAPRACAVLTVRLALAILPPPPAPPIQVVVAKLDPILSTHPSH